MAGRPGPRACRRHGARRLIICANASHINCAGEEEALWRKLVTLDAARYVPSSSSNNKRATAPSPPLLHRTTAAAAATAFRVGDGGCGRRRLASAAIVVGDGTSTAARARRWRGLDLGRMVVSATRRAPWTQRIREKVFLSLLQNTSAERVFSLVHLDCRVSSVLCAASRLFYNARDLRRRARQI